MHAGNLSSVASPAQFFSLYLWTLIEAARRYPEYFAVVIAKKHANSAPAFTEDEIRDTLIRIGRRDLWNRRQRRLKTQASKPHARKKKARP